MSKRIFLDSIERYAYRAALRANVPVVPKAVAAQAALESRWGESALAREANNLFGVKATPSWAGPVYVSRTREWDGQNWVETVAKFRQYEDFEHAVADYVFILRLPWYRDAVEAARYGDPYGFLYGLEAGHGEPGWATDPGYAKKVLSIMQDWDLLSGPHPVWAALFYLNAVRLPVRRISISRTATAGTKLFVEAEVKTCKGSIAGWLHRLRSFFSR